MIIRYSDHSANERTFLAWVRTSIAIMAFGFLIERFDLFLRLASPELAGRSDAAHSRVANAVGLMFLVVGMAMTAISALRFFRTAKQIDAEESVAASGVRFDLALATLLFLLGCSLLMYLLSAVVQIN